MQRVGHIATGKTISPREPHGDGIYLPVLDGWRAVAILVVMLFHGLHNTRVAPGSLLAAFASLSGHVGAMGVLIFFAISGYLITTRLLADSRQTGHLWRLFFLRRLFRILPAMAVYLAVIGLLGFTRLIQLDRNDWYAPLFLANYFPGSWYTLHFWSLAVEEHFYLLWPLCIALAGWWRALWIGIAIMGAVGAWRGYRLAHLGIAPGDPNFDTVRGVFLSHTDARLDYIMAGCVLALLLVFYPGITNRLLHRCGSGAGLLCLLLLLTVSASLKTLDLHTPQAICIALIVVGTARTPSWLADKLLSHPVMLFIGKLSYSLYLWQQLLLALSKSEWLQAPMALPLKFAAALVAAYLSYRFVERPMIQQGRRIAAHWLLTQDPALITPSKIEAV
jgi:peptidoglycan/LPS O-acetylase OafA/YrhL